VSVNGKHRSISEYGGLFESVTVPAGTTTLSFDYVPRHESWGWGAMGLGAAALLGEAYLSWRRARRAEDQDLATISR
jgi:hypothetical protein